MQRLEHSPSVRVLRCVSLLYSHDRAVPGKLLHYTATIGLRLASCSLPDQRQDLWRTLPPAASTECD
jgi:hypothetical protein